MPLIFLVGFKQLLDVPDDVKVMVIRPRSRVNPWVYHTAILKRAIRDSLTKTIVVTRSWLDEPMTPTWKILGRIIHRVVLKHAGVYAVNLKVASTIPDYISASSGFVAEERLDWPAVHTGLELYQRRQYPAALDPTMVNICGHLHQAKYLFVGDRINPRFAHFNHWPFYDNSASAFFMAEALHQLEFPESEGMWTNAHVEGRTENHISTLLSIKPGLKIVALGQNARNYVVSLPDIRLSQISNIPHPSYARRFGLANLAGRPGRSRVENYADMLREVLV